MYYINRIKHGQGIEHFGGFDSLAMALSISTLLHDQGYRVVIDFKDEHGYYHFVNDTAVTA